MIHIHALDGCAPTPLAHYLKALGILRLVTEQADVKARGWWDGERFRLATILDRAALGSFFLNHYRPTPLLAPWNKGSGFYGSDPDVVLKPLLDSSAERFESIRSGIRAGQALLGEIAVADNNVRQIKAESKDKSLSRTQRESLKESPDYKQRLTESERIFKELKSDLIPDCRLHWRGPQREWMDAALVLDGDDIPRFPALLGTGGNDGRLDFTNNYMQRLGEVFDLSDSKGAARPGAGAWLRAALWQESIAGCQNNKAVGQFLPGTAGGANNSTGPDAESLLNPFDFLLMLEGVLLFSAHATRRLGNSERSRAAAPFVISAQGAGYASAAVNDESARGEQWMPLWSQPITFVELRRLLAEGRAQVGARAVREPLDMARAVARLGVARGISGFQRFGYIERNGQANLAVPLGRFEVRQHIAPTLACLDDIDVWLRRLRSDTRSDNSPARLKQAERYLSDTLFAVIQHPDEAMRWQAVLLALAAVEAVQRTGSGLKAGPMPPLRDEWLLAASQGDGNTPELRLAFAFAMQRVGRQFVRRYWLPLDDRGLRYVVNSEGKLQVNPSVVMEGRNGQDDAIALLTRSLVEGAQQGQRNLPLLVAAKAGSSVSDLSLLLAGQVDLDRTLALARALMALKAKHLSLLSAPRSNNWPDDAWLAIRLALFPQPIRDDGKIIPADPAIIRRLAAGDAATAVDLALRRLRAAGVGTTIRFASVAAQTARLWAVALAFPIHRSIARRFLEQRLETSRKEFKHEPRFFET